MSRLLVVALVVFAVGCGKPEPPRPDPPRGDGPNPDGTPPAVTPAKATFPPADWTHKELAEHLAKKGVKVGVVGLPLFSSPTQPVAAFVRGRGQAFVYRCADPKAAADKAGSLGGPAFAAGRFAFGPSAGPGKDPNDLALLSELQGAF